MGYTMEFHVDGGCRNNGQQGAFAAAAAVLSRPSGRSTSYTRRLPLGEYDTPNPTNQRLKPTNQRAEITAIIMALEIALSRYEDLHSSLRLHLTIFSDSQYAVKCMNEWIYKWSGNGWMNAKGNEVVNKELIWKASKLDDRVEELGSVKYEWVPRERNQVADRACGEELDEMAEGSESSGYSSDSW